MLDPTVPRFGFSAAIVILLITFQMSACSTEEDLAATGTAEVYAAAKKDPNTKPDKGPGNGKGNGKSTGSNRNTAAVISGVDHGSVIEDVDPDADNLLEVSGKLDISDIDTGEASFTEATIVGNYGSLVIDPAGNWNYAASNSLPAIQSLGFGVSLLDIIKVSSVDGTTHNVIINIAGVNDTAIFSGVNSGIVTEDVDPDADNLLETSGKLIVTDTDTGESAFIGATLSGIYGSINITPDGNWSYSADNRQSVIQNLANGALLTDSLTVHSVDGSGRNVIITIVGVDEPAVTNNPAIIGGIDSGSVAEDIDPDADGLLETAGTLTISDPDDGEAAFIAAFRNGTYGSITIDTHGNWNYAARNSLQVIQGLGVGDSLTDTIAVSSIDGTVHNVVVHINGANDIASISGVSSGSVTEDIDPDADGLLETAGALTISDPDTGEATFIAALRSGAYGNITIDTQGNWHYSVDNNLPAIQNLSSGQSLVDTLTVSSVDGTIQNVSVVIVGADDTTAQATLSWVPPVERQDNTPISLAEIAGYRIYYGSTQGQYPVHVDVADGNTTGYTFTGFSRGTYYFVITTYDTNGRESTYSPEVVLNL